MKTKHFELLEDLVGTKYGDLTGLIQIDCHDNISDIYELCAENGIERDKYFVIGFGISEFTTDGVGKQGDVTCSILLLDKEKYAGSFDEIKSQLLKNPTVDVIKKSVYVDYKDLGKYIKRFDALLLTEMGKYIKEINIMDDEE